MNERKTPPLTARLRMAFDLLRFEMAFRGAPRAVVLLVERVARRVLSDLRLQWRRIRPRNDETATRLPPRTPLALPVRPIACGKGAAAIFPADGGTRHATPVCPARVIDIVVSDLPGQRTASQPAVVLADHPRLAVPAFDPRAHNPVGWRRNVGLRVASLGPLDRLPPGALARHALKSTDLHLARRCHHVEDVRSFHDGAAERAGALVRLAATGVPVHVLDDDPQLEALLGPDLYRLVKTGIGEADEWQRETHSIRSRRAALRGHTALARMRQLCQAAGLEPPPLPSISVLLPTRRPDFLFRAVANVAGQDYPRLELVLALHGDGFADVEVARAVAPLAGPVEIVRAEAERPFTGLLNAATAAANGDLVTKMDDDDLYDPHHVWDLALAHEYAAAHLVGKGLEFVYLARRDQTLALRRDAAESDSPHLAGGTLMISRDDLRAIGGWQGMAPYEDRILIDNVARAGGRVYQTHGTGYLLVRHGQRHSWEVPDGYFDAKAEEIHNGFRPSVAGIDEARPWRNLAG